MRSRAASAPRYSFDRPKLATSAFRLTDMLNQGPQTEAAAWDIQVDVLVFVGHDTNWRRTPSVFDQMRGYKVMPSQHTPWIRAGP